MEKGTAGNVRVQVERTPPNPGQAQLSGESGESLSAMKRLLSTVMIIVLTASLSACTITFDAVPGTGNPPLMSLTTEGFTFTSTHLHAIGEPEFCLFGGCVSNGTVYIVAEATSRDDPITMTSATGVPFTLRSFQGAQVFLDNEAASSGGFPNANGIIVFGTLAGGEQVAQGFSLTSTLNPVGFQTFILPPTFTNLVSVSFVGAICCPTFVGAIALDNIVFELSPEQISAEFEELRAEVEELSSELAPRKRSKVEKLREKVEELSSELTPRKRAKFEELRAKFEELSFELAPREDGDPVAAE